jgi:hypothetical protein
MAFDTGVWTSSAIQVLETAGPLSEVVSLSTNGSRILLTRKSGKVKVVEDVHDDNVGSVVALHERDLGESGVGVWKGGNAFVVTRSGRIVGVGVSSEVVGALVTKRRKEVEGLMGGQLVGIEGFEDGAKVKIHVP